MEQLEKECFKKGAEVEVSLEEPGFRGSWYTATVIRPGNKRTRKMVLDLHNLRADERSSKRLRESVDVILVRPVPPRESGRRRFELSEEVDAYHNEGWWEGVVTGVHEGGERYSVFFRSSREQIDFNHSDLRLHREWVYGKWVPPLQQQEDTKDKDDDENEGENGPQK